MPLAILGTLSALCLITSLLPFVPLPHGVFRSFEFPRIQNAIIAATGLVAAFWFLPFDLWSTFLVHAAFSIALAIQLFHIARFSPFWPRRSAAFNGDPGTTPIVRMLVSNVKQGNRDYSRIRELMANVDPDIAIFMETDQPWIDALADVTSDYRHRMECSQDNGFGMLLVCRFAISDNEIRFLLQDEVPSFHLTVHCGNGSRFRLIALHPEPPLIHDDTVGRDSEIALVGKLVRDDDRPIVVTGDLNDVAWSRTTRRFLRIARLLDPREGRGQYNTFDARYFFLRWPLDHIFHSPHFQLVSMKRMPFVGSDHFPMYYELALAENAAARREIDRAKREDLDEAEKLIEEEKERDDRPAGVDWEK